MHIASSISLAPVGSFWRRSVVPFTCILQALSQAFACASLISAQGLYFGASRFLQTLVHCAKFTGVPVILRQTLRFYCVLLEILSWPFFSLESGTLCCCECSTQHSVPARAFFFKGGLHRKILRLLIIGLGEISRLLTIGLA